MAQPKKKVSKRKGAQRRAQWKIAVNRTVECPQCHNARLPHHVCPTCGYYDGRAVVEVAAE